MTESPTHGDLIGESGKKEVNKGGEKKTTSHSPKNKLEEDAYNDL